MDRFDDKYAKIFSECLNASIATRNSKAQELAYQFVKDR
jgi:hypothetical protein